MATSFNPSAESLSLSANHAVQDPQENETYEVGTKWDLLHERLNVSGACFRTQQVQCLRDRVLWIRLRC